MTQVLSMDSSNMQDDWMHYLLTIYLRVSEVDYSALDFWARPLLRLGLAVKIKQLNSK